MTSRALLSMTGFGRASAQAGPLTVIAEARSVNGRFLKTSWRLPEALSAHEAKFEGLIKQAVVRGTVNLSLKVEGTSEAILGIRVDRDRAVHFYRELLALRSDLGGDDPINLADLLRLPGVLVDDGGGGDAADEVVAAAEAALRGALAALNEMRAAEGAALASDIRARCETLIGLNAQARERSPQVVAEYRQKLADRIARLLSGSGVEARPEDLAREVAHFADRCDIAEENQRLEHHLRSVQSALQGGGEAGKKLDFMAQELLREANTMGSKANDGVLTGLVIQMKGEIEKIKEQIQNVE